MSYIDVFAKDLDNFVTQYKQDQATLNVAQNRTEKLRADIADYEKVLAVLKVDIQDKREALGRACDGREETLKVREDAIGRREKEADAKYADANSLRETWSVKNGELDALKAGLSAKDADLTRRLNAVAAAAR